MLNSLLQKFIAVQQRWCRAFDRRFLPAEWRVDGNRDFLGDYVRDQVEPGSIVYDVGGGKQPFFSREEKRLLRLQVAGVDISQADLDAAPDGAYDRAIQADITAYAGPGDGDIVICQALLEHVPDVDRAISAIASLLKPSGKALIFVPCRNAAFARLNLLLPQSWKTRLLFAIFPEAQRGQGFPSHYHRCTPADFRAIAQANGLTFENLKCYYMSAYFSFLFPAYVLWRAWLVIAHALGREQACETFSVLMRKAPLAQGAAPAHNTEQLSLA